MHKNKLGGLNHAFTCSETKRLKKYTEYSIQMISFPKNQQLFHCLTKIKIEKRYSDFKKLETELQNVYKCYNFKTFFKTNNTNYFTRYANFFLIH